MVNDNTKLTTNGKDYFSSRAGEAEQAWETVDVSKKWTLAQDKSGLHKKLTQSDTLVRGLFGTYVGIGDAKLNAGEIFNVRPKGYNTTLKYKQNEFDSRFNVSSPYYPISDRLEWGSTSVDCYRGDCYVGNFTHRMHRNFIDSELPLNNKIVDPYTWHKKLCCFSRY